MHALTAHATRVPLLLLHGILSAGWRPILVALAAACAGRLLKLAPALAAALAVAAGWLALALSSAGHFPATPSWRLAALGGWLAGETLLRQRGSAWWMLPAAAALAAWLIRGAPVGGNVILNAMPVFLGLLAALPLARRIAGSAPGAALPAAGLAMAGALAVSLAPAAAAKSALIVAAASAPLFSQAEAAAPVASALVLAAALLLGASDHGRLTGADLACLAPLAVWGATPPLSRALAKSGPAAAALLAAAACVVLAWALMRGVL